jgi:hypothetical protein
VRLKVVSMGLVLLGRKRGKVYYDGRLLGLLGDILLVHSLHGWDIICYYNRCT